jgi:DNA-binding NtrC family response regulator
VRARRFREDLYYRLHVIPIELPPLRERGNDILLIARHFLAEQAREEGKRFSSFSSQAAEILQTYSWPGNVRQLLNVLRNVVVLNDGEVVTPSMLPELQHAVRAAQPDRTREVGAAAANGGGNLSDKGIRPLWLVEKQAIEEAVELCGGNVLQAAARLGISDSTIYRKRRAWEQTELTC